MTETQFAPLIKRLIALFPQRPISAETIAAYWEMLHDLDAELFAVAVKHCAASCEWFPTVKQLRKAAEQSPGAIRLRNLRYMAQSDSTDDPELVEWLNTYRPHLPLVDRIAS